MYRISNGETIIDSHSVVVARRGLLVFLYKQMSKLLNGKESIFEYSNNKLNDKLCVIRSKYRFHLYMKDPPCGVVLSKMLKEDEKTR